MKCIPCFPNFSKTLLLLGILFQSYIAKQTSRCYDLPYYHFYLVNNGYTYTNQNVISVIDCNRAKQIESTSKMKCWTWSQPSDVIQHREKFIFTEFTRIRSDSNPKTIIKTWPFSFVFKKPFLKKKLAMQLSLYVCLLLVLW